MKPGIFHQIILTLLAFLFSLVIMGQIVKKPGTEIVAERTMAILAINPCIGGSFYLNDYLMTDIPANDTVYIYNLKKGGYNVKFITDTNPYSGYMIFRNGIVNAIRLCNDSISSPKKFMSWDQAVRGMSGKKIASARVKQASFYNITQFALFNFLVGGGGDPSTSFFQSFTIINGYQVIPALCAGIGISYNYYPFEKMTTYGVEIQNARLNCLPVFADIRAHLPPRSKSITAFFKFGIGYNFLLKKTTYESVYIDNTTTYVANKGGIYISPGFGLRIFISDLVQIIPSLEYSFEKSSYTVSPVMQEPYTKNNNFSFLKINLGVGFQYK
jgi:hypothetical protein